MKTDEILQEVDFILNIHNNDSEEMQQVMLEEIDQVIEATTNGETQDGNEDDSENDGEYDGEEDNVKTSKDQGNQTKNST